jgi:MYXO-CTERM domain-containing protein
MRTIQSHRPQKRLAKALALFVLSTSAATPALASENFPSALRDAAGPDCIICHTVSPGVSTTATQVFALSMRDAGLKAGDADSVEIALDALPVDHDSDGDGMSDVDELTAEGMRDPSQSGAGSPCGADVKYGCGAHVSPTPEPHPWGWPLLLSALGFLAFGARSIRRRKPS